MAFTLVLVGDLSGDSQAIAQQVSPQLRQNFLSDPLTTKPRDPLLPMISVERPLSPLELSALSASLDQLNQTAQEQLAAGQTDAAFELLLRELRLRRIFGPVAEFNALSQTAALAWNQQRPVEVQLLTLRTREIWETVQAALGQIEMPRSLGEESPEALADNPERVLVSGDASSDRAVLTAITQTFTTLRDIDSAVSVYETLIELTVAQGEDPTVQQQALAELHLAWFQFAEAADVYLALLNQARADGNQTEEVAYLERLAYSYQQADSLAYAVRAQTDLLALYQTQGELEKLPRLLVAIAQNYRALNLPDTAIEYYRSAYSAAQRFEQFSFSARVLQDLGALYETVALYDEALGAYNLLIPVEQQAYNDYGVMNAYDKIGQLQRRRGNPFEALKAFEQGLAIANRLDLRQTYFVEQIESVTPSL
ncbi:hypothetical protein [Leptolyngbya sp. BC1307]|uniref:tetratricopeptide repeat protein n=1 Tax=Leptolyngbya sp. BC1307 TaxID=2029589 RepID=UPI000EFA37B4|nr:hypothetical protein [Leptolyngbya sp. BC1307]